MAVNSDLRIGSSSGDYIVSVGPGTFDRAMSRRADVVIIDSALVRLLPPTDLPVLTVEADEESKTLGGVEKLIRAMREAGIRRGHHAVAVGGGVVQDVATFATDIYMRGISWTYVPSTLMAMADSCIGGKSSINVGDMKNLVGGFHPPTTVVVDPMFLETLSPSALSAGFAEAAKIAFCRGDQAFQGYLERFERFETDPADLLLHVLEAKRWFVEIDEHDQKERRLLNFGHTFGHALESAVGHRVSHGVAVAVGMLCAIAHPASTDTPSVKQLEAHSRLLLSRVNDLASALDAFDEVTYEKAFRSDKKHTSDAFHLIVPGSGEGVVEVQTEADEAGWANVVRATRSTLDSLRSKR